MFSIFDRLVFTVKASRETPEYLAFFNTFKVKNINPINNHDKNNRLSLFRERHNLSINISDLKSIGHIDLREETTITESSVWSLSEVMSNVPILANEYTTSLEALLKETISKIAKDHKILELITSSSEEKNSIEKYDTFVASCCNIARFINIMSSQIIILTQRLIYNPSIAAEHNELYQRSLYSQIYSCINKMESFSCKILCSLKIAKHNRLLDLIKKHEKNEKQLLTAKLC